MTTPSPSKETIQDLRNFVAGEYIASSTGRWLDNWDPAQPPYPAEFGLVPESNESDNVLGPYSRGPAIFLPVFILRD